MYSMNNARRVHFQMAVYIDHRVSVSWCTHTHTQANCSIQFPLFSCTSNTWGEVCVHTQDHQHNGKQTSPQLRANAAYLLTFTHIITSRTCYNQIMNKQRWKFGIHKKTTTAYDCNTHKHTHMQRHKQTHIYTHKQQHMIIKHTQTHTHIHTNTQTNKHI